MKIIQTVPVQNIFFKESQIAMGDMPAKTEQAVINVFDEVQYQEVLGFGAALTESAAYNYSLMDDATKKEFIRLYFDKKDGIAYNFGRTHINSCDFSLGFYSYVKDGDKTLDSFSIEHDKQYIIPMIKDILAVTGEELVLFASPWSPPAYMKDNNSLVAGGKLLEEYKESWALYYAKYIKAYAAEGIKISAITIQNEPIAKQTWESCCYSAEEERDFIREYLIPVLDREGLSDIKLIIWDHNKERVYDRARDTLSDPKVNKRVWAVGHHWYSGDHFDGLSLVHERLHKPLICTEFCGTMKHKNAAELAERYGKEIAENFNHYEIASCDWNILLNQNGGPFHNRSKRADAISGVPYDDVEGGCYAPILFNHQTGTLEITPIYYYIGHFSKFVRRGAKRIAVTKYSDALYAAAFINPDGERVLIVVNSSDLELPIRLRYHGECTGLTTQPHSIMTCIF